MVTPMQRCIGFSNYRSQSVVSFQAIFVERVQARNGKMEEYPLPPG
jgi:hypothetical protein